MLRHMNQKFVAKNVASKHSLMRLAPSASSPRSMNPIKSTRSLLASPNDAASTMRPCSTSRALSFHGASTQKSSVSCVTDLSGLSSDGM